MGEGAALEERKNRIIDLGGRRRSVRGASTYCSLELKVDPGLQPRPPYAYTPYRAGVCRTAATAAAASAISLRRDTLGAAVSGSGSGSGQGGVEGKI